MLERMKSVDTFPLDNIGDGDAVRQSIAVSLGAFDLPEVSREWKKKKKMKTIPSVPEFTTIYFDGSCQFIWRDLWKQH